LSRLIPPLPGYAILCARSHVAASSGAACSSGGSEPSHVLKAMGVPADEALAAVRFSLGSDTTHGDVGYLLNKLPPLLAPLLAPLLREEMTTPSTTESP